MPMTSPSERLAELVAQAEKNPYHWGATHRGEPYEPRLCSGCGHATVVAPGITDCGACRSAAGWEIGS